MSAQNNFFFLNILSRQKAKKKKCLISGHPSFLGPTPIFSAISESFSSISRVHVCLMIFMLFLYIRNFYQKKNSTKFAYLLTLKNIEKFPETRHLFFFLPKSYLSRNHTLALI